MADPARLNGVWRDLRARFLTIFPERLVAVHSGGRVRCIALTPLAQAALGLAGAGLLAWIAVATVGYIVRGADLDRLDPRATIPASAGEAKSAHMSGQGLNGRGGTPPGAILGLSDPFEATLAMRARLHAVAERGAALSATSSLAGHRLPVLRASAPGLPGVMSGSLLHPAVLAGQSEKLVPVTFRREQALPAAPLAPMPPLPPMRRATPSMPFSGPPVAALDLEQLRNVYSRALDDRDPQRADIDVPPLPPLDRRDAPQSFLSWLVDRASEQIEAGERVLALIGLDPGRLLGNKDDGIGGPFVPFTADARSRDGAVGRDDSGVLDLAALDVSIERWSDLRRTLRQLPLGTPVNQAEVGSNFGRRVDPINGRSAFHGGIDFRGPRGSEIYATGSGVVTFAGRRGRYGRTVEVDHGNGVVSVYAHLDRIKVNKGDIVTRRMEIGTMGSSGRTTGVHLHYEVRVDGEPRDPSRFVTAGRYVQSL